MLRLLSLFLVMFCIVGIAGAGSLDIPVHGYGLSFGNSTEFSGLRFNWRDHDLQRIDGITVSFWAPDKHPTGTIRGLSLGLCGTAA